MYNYPNVYNESKEEVILFPETILRVNVTHFVFKFQAGELKSTYSDTEIHGSKNSKENIANYQIFVGCWKRRDSGILVRRAGS